MSPYAFKLFRLPALLVGALVAVVDPAIRRTARWQPPSSFKHVEWLTRAEDQATNDILTFPFAEQRHFMIPIAQKLREIRHPEECFGLTEKIQPVLSILYLRKCYTRGAYSAADKSGEYDFVADILASLHAAHQHSESRFYLPTAIDGCLALIEERLNTRLPFSSNLSSVGELRLDLLVRNLVAHYAPAYPRIDFRSRVDFRGPILVDRLRWFALLDNAVRNSVAAIDGAGIVTISVRTELTSTSPNDRLVVEVQDNGSGMPANILQRVASEVPIGRGLWIIREILRMNSAVGLIESTPGAGTRFSAFFDMKGILKAS